MKIDPPGPKQVRLPSAVEGQPAKPQANPRADSGQTGVTLSARASQLKQLESQLAAVPVVDRARVESIKQAIASGQYAVNPENIAAGLIDSVKEMLHVAK
jgi:negative regulator of flagellin synthesis FlgM